ncbi:hypothetical protein CPB85DRAFT_1456636 [Mucidula mucida]|nr:hypothetical protein CPB85DRAFT_1456636 [Mucidula mucida]
MTWGETSEIGIPELLAPQNGTLHIRNHSLSSPLYPPLCVYPVQQPHSICSVLFLPRVQEGVLQVTATPETVLTARCQGRAAPVLPWSTLMVLGKHRESSFTASILNFAPSLTNSSLDCTTDNTSRAVTLPPDDLAPERQAQHFFHLAGIFPEILPGRRGHFGCCSLRRPRMSPSGEHGSSALINQGDRAVKLTAVSIGLFSLSHFSKFAGPARPLSLLSSSGDLCGHFVYIWDAWILRLNGAVTLTITCLAGEQKNFAWPARPITLDFLARHVSKGEARLDFGTHAYGCDTRNFAWPARPLTPGFDSEPFRGALVILRHLNHFVISGREAVTFDGSDSVNKGSMNSSPTRGLASIDILTRSEAALNSDADVQRVDGNRGITSYKSLGFLSEVS